MIGQVSPDGKWKWDGTQWVAVPLPPVQPGRVNPFQDIPWLRTGAGWKLAVGGFGVLLFLAATTVAIALSAANSSGPQIAQVRPSDIPSAITKSLPSKAATASPSPSPSPSPTPTPSPLQIVVASQAPPQPPPTPGPNTCGAPANPWGYNFCGGNLIYSPPSNFCAYFNCIPSFWKSTNGYVDQCNDGTYSHSGGRQGACSTHRGELRPLYSP